VSLGNNIPALLLAGPYGSLADKYGRKLAILIPQMGLMAIVAVYFYIGYARPVAMFLYMLLAANILSGVSGGGGVLQMGIFTYASDITEDDPASRTLIFTVLESTLFFAKILGPPIGNSSSIVYYPLIVLLYFLRRPKLYLRIIVLITVYVKVCV
jgi:MFS family permease